MTTLHGEIAVCRHHFVSHGKRRRRCARCGCTKTLWKKKRGPKRHPRRTRRLHPTFRKRRTIRERAESVGLSIDRAKRRHRGDLAALEKKPWSVAIPSGDLILIFDAVWFNVADGGPWTLYNLALRSVEEDRAVFLRPILRPGHESRKQWREVIDLSFPSAVQKRVKALVSDSFKGVESISREMGWRLQRCQFHLLRRVANLCRCRKKNIGWKEGRKEVERLIREAVGTKDEGRCRGIDRRLETLSKDPECTTAIRLLVREFLRRQSEYRSCLLYPELRLPSTTNTIESLNSRIRGMLERSRGIRTPTALRRWVVAYVWFNPTSFCRPKTPQN